MRQSIAGKKRTLRIMRIVKWYVGRASSLDLRDGWELQFSGIDLDAPYWRSGKSKVIRMPPHCKSERGQLQVLDGRMVWSILRPDKDLARLQKGLSTTVTPKKLAHILLPVYTSSSLDCNPSLGATLKHPLPGVTFGSNMILKRATPRPPSAAHN